MNIRKNMTITFALAALALGMTTTKASAQPVLKGSFDLPGATPAYQVQVRSQWDLNRKFSFDTGLYYVSALPAIGVPGYVRTDARLGWRATPTLDFSLVGQNLLNGRHLEFVSTDYVAGDEPGRTAYLKVTWSF